jgi:hypothetical protein
MSERYYLSDIGGAHLLTTDRMFCPMELVGESREDLFSLSSREDAVAVCALLKQFECHLRPMTLAEATAGNGNGNGNGD